jgi:hypothetical protein
MLSDLVTFIVELEKEFSTSMMGVLNLFWAGYYGIFLTPAIIYITWFGIRYMAGSLSGDKLKKEFNKIFVFLALAGLGYIGLPLIEQMAQAFNKEIAEREKKIVPGLIKAQEAKIANLKEKYKTAMAYSGISDQDNNQFNTVVSGMENYLVERQAYVGPIALIAFDNDVMRETEKASRTLTGNEVTRVGEIITESGAYSYTFQNAVDDQKAIISEVQTLNKLNRLKDIDPKNYSATDSFGILDFTLTDLFIVIFEWIGTLFQIVVRVMRMILLIMFRLTLPITLAITLLPTFESALKSWWEGYKTIALMLIPITLVNILTHLAWLISNTIADNMAITLFNAVIAFLSGGLYMITPTLTVIFFGGSQQVASLPQQMIMSGAATGALMVKAGKFLKGGNNQGQQRKNQDQTRGQQGQTNQSANQELPVA